MGRPPLTAAIRLVVHGRVQGVGFRWFVREAARRADLAGWVRNNPDGSVELVAGGDARALGEFRRLVETGPPGAAVARVDDSPAEVDQQLPHPFTVLR